VIAVIFEVWAKDEHRQAYLDLAAELRPLLEKIDGFISIERFASLAEPDKLMSISFWRNEEAVAEWRRVEAHRTAQARGRARMFRDYRIRVAEVLRDYGKDHGRDQAPADSRAFHKATSSS
jgi:heme-degrading monooxygenase HmoA